MKKVIVITGASSGFGALTARALAKAGHIVYAGMREYEGSQRVGGGIGSRVCREERCRSAHARA